MADYRDYKFDPDEYNKALMRGVYDDPAPVAAIPDRPAGGFMPAFKQSIGSTVSGIGRLASDFIPGVDADNGLKQWGDDYTSANPTAIHSLEDVKESPWLATKEALGGAAGFMAPMLATVPVGGVLKLASGAGKVAALTRSAGSVAQKAGPVASMIPASYGGIRETQGVEAQALPDKLLALGGAGVVAGIETAFGPQQWALATMKKEGREALAKKFGEGALLSRVGKGAIRGAAIEGTEELVQNPIEQAAAYQKPWTEENIEQTMFGGVMGVLAGGVMGGGFGAVVKKKDLTNPAVKKQELDTGEQGSLYAETLPAPRTMIDEGMYKKLRQLGADHDTALFATRRDAYGIKMREALEAGQPTELEYRKDVEKQLVKEGADIETATLAALPSEERRQTYRYLKSIGLTRSDAIKQAMMVDPISADAQGSLFTPEGKGKFAYTGEIASKIKPKKAGPRVDLGTAQPFDYGIDMSAPGYGGSTIAKIKTSTKETLKDSKPGIRADLAKTLDDHLASGRITQQDHELLMGDVENPEARPIRIKQAIARTIAATAKERSASQEVAAEGETQLPSTNAFDTFSASLPKQQKAVFYLVRQAAENNELDKFISPEGAWQATAMGEALGMSRQAAHKAVKDLRAKLDSAAGMDVKAALAERTKAVRVTELSDAERLGLSPAMQSQQVEEAELFGTENGAEASMGTIETVGGSQGAVGEAEAPPGYVESVEPSAKTVEENQAQKIRDVLEAVRGGELTDAVYEWNQLVGRIPELESEIPTDVRALLNDEANLDLLHAIVSAYQDIQVEVEATVDANKFFDEIGAYEYEFRRIAREHSARTKKVAELGVEREGTALEEKSGTGEGTGEDGVEPKKPVKVEQKKRRVIAKPEEGTKLSEKTPGVTRLANRFNALQEAIESAETEENAAKAEAALEKFFETVPDNVLRKVMVEANKRRGAVVTDKASLEDLIEEAELSETAGTENPISAETLTSRLKAMFRFAPLFDKTVKVYPTQADAIAKGALSEKAGLVAGFKTADGKVGLIAENIEDGQELSIFLHEVGVHLGMEKLIGKNNMRWLDSKILEWSELNDGSPEALAAKEAVRRSEKSTTDDNAEGRIAYMVEELVKNGVKPKALVGKAEGWLNRVVSAMRTALLKLKLKWLDYSGQNLVDLAFGAAGIELGAVERPTDGTVQPVAEETKRLDPVNFKSWQAMQRAERFIKKQGLYKTVSKAKMEDGTYDVVRIKLEPKEGTKFSEVSTAPAFKASIEKMSNIATVEAKDASRFAALMPFTRDLVKWASKHMPSAMKFWDAINERMATTRSWSLRAHEVTQAFIDLPVDSQEKVQRFLFDGKTSGKWGFLPKWHKDAAGLLTSSGMKRKWELLSQEEKQVAEATLKLGYDTRQAHIDGVRKTVEAYRSYAAGMDADTKKEIDHDVAAKMKELSLWSGYTGPYVPTMRFGDYFVEAKSKKYLEAERDGDQAKLLELRKDPAEYIYSHFLSASEAQRAVDSLTGFEQKNNGPRAARPAGRKADFTALARLDTLLKHRVEREGATQIRALLNQLMLDMTDEYSERQSRQQYKAVAGAKWDEVMRSVATRGQQVAFEIGALNHNKDASTAIADMRKELEDAADRSTATNLFNEIQERFEQSFDNTEIDRGIQRVMGAVSLWKLLTNPVYYLVQLIQPYQYSLPSMYRYFGVRESWGELTGTMDVIKNVVKQSGVGRRVAEDMSWVGDAKNPERQMLEWLQKRNLLDIGMESEIGSLEGEHKVTQMMNQMAIRPLRNAVQNTEIVNRVSTALATYRLAKKKGWSEAKARSVVEQVINDTHGLYAGFNAPRFLNTRGLMRIPMQFRKFQLIQATFLYKNLVEEVRNYKGGSPEEKAVATRVIAGTLAHTLAVAGLKGSVLWLVVASLMAAGSDDDDPRSNELKMKQWLTDNFSEGFSDLIMHGLPTAVGVNISNRTAVNPLAVLPFDNQSLLKAVSSKKDLQENAFALAGGAAGGLLADVVDGFDQMSKGDVYKGLATMSPSAVKNLMRAGMYATAGASQRDGDITLTPEEFSAWSLMQQGLGVPPVVVQKAQFKQTQLTEMRNEFKEQVTSLKKRYIDGDVGERAEVRKEWQDMRKAMQKIGLKPTPMLELMRAPAEKRKRERGMIDGVETSASTRRAVERM